MSRGQKVGPPCVVANEVNKGSMSRATEHGHIKLPKKESRKIKVIKKRLFVVMLFRLVVGRLVCGIFCLNEAN